MAVVAEGEGEVVEVEVEEAVRVVGSLLAHP